MVMTNAMMVMTDAMMVMTDSMMVMCHTLGGVLMIEEENERG